MSDELPEWLAPLAKRAAAATARDFTRLPTPTGEGRASAVLVLFGEGPDGPDVLMLERAADMRNHAGQPAFPGGAADPGDADAVATALREANEEVGLDPASVTVLAELPKLWIPISRFVVTPVLAWWHAPHPVHPRQPAEVAHVARLPIAELCDPDHRLQVRHGSGWIGPAFDSQGMVVWGFTAGVLSALLDMGGWSRPWPRDRVAELDERLRPVLVPSESPVTEPAAPPPADDVSGPLA
ncbi:NUDIX hydrolase [Catenuloplanes atrovinosus]|uniref:8-oxo-dGTP pyrophosphatase MutT (NUDIX family) n=1 Tax=Catenuloplanes atrovinosus TaxID=137266 RepID=A0AAE4CEP9_9ACTN|nr:8-oxo-dGTP pyrophosphatase MutT (NUDIX family) [Catenuloplanes atrovinosus]